MNPFNYSVKELKKTANLLRQDVVRMITEAGSGHPAGSLGMVDVFSVLYFRVLSYDPKNPVWPERDRLILSNGHICPVLYASLARAGYFSIDELKTLRKLGSRLQGHPSKASLPFIEASTGSLGHGLSVAAGMAWVAQKNNESYHIWCIMSDAEHQEGSTWEAVMFAAKYHLSLKAIIDYNKIQLSGNVREIMPLGNLAAKYQSFGWRVFKVNGNNIRRLIQIFQRALKYEKGPCVVIAKTIPGKGVSFMENKWEWHGKAPSAEEAKMAIKELNRKNSNLKMQISK